MFSSSGSSSDSGPRARTLDEVHEGGVAQHSVQKQQERSVDKDEGDPHEEFSKSAHLHLTE